MMLGIDVLKLVLSVFSVIEVIGSGVEQSLRNATMRSVFGRFLSLVRNPVPGTHVKLECSLYLA